VHLSDFDYVLPPELIAQHPAAERTASRLLHLDGRTGAIADRRFADMVDLLDPGDVLVVNDTRVIKARLHGRKDSGGEVEVLVERVLDAHRALAQVRASKTPKPGRKLLLGEGVEAEVLGRRGEFFELRFDDPVLDTLARHGEVPLPPYITHEAIGEDESRYQTVYAREPGAVAAPTAGLHFDRALLDAVRARGVEIATVTLHVGAGTFQPVRVEDLSQHVMHSEWYGIAQAAVDAIARARKKKRARRGGRDHHAPRPRIGRGNWGGGARGRGSRNPALHRAGVPLPLVDRLVTNFHLPRSTLLMLVSAFAGTENIRRAYAHAVAERYRFFSYGDAMLLERS
jgi:S-adenosylmethionine:tRNA ribosyltransferase-isomerase